MRLFERVLATITTLPRPPRPLLCPLLRVRRRRPGPVTCRHVSRDRPDPAHTGARPCATSVAVVALHKAALTPVVPPDPAQARGLEARLVPNSGPRTDGLARFWNGAHSRPEPGLAIAPLGWREGTDHGADALRLDQSPPTGPAPDPERTRLARYRDQGARSVQPPALSPLRDVGAEGSDRTHTGLAGGQAFGLQQLGPWRRAAPRRALAAGPPRPGPGRPTP